MTSSVADAKPLLQPSGRHLRGKSPEIWEAALRTRSLAILSAAAVLLLSQAFIPIDHFILRGDDAYYYFQLAANYPEHGYWTFDGIHPSNGVQPLWAITLTGAAQVLNWFGIHDEDVLARVFVALAAAAHFASSLVLFHLLARVVSTGTAIAAAGAFLFPMGIVWQRVWGMENSVYALLLITAVAYYHLAYRAQPTYQKSVVFGTLLGLTTLARLNAVFLLPCVLVHFLFLARTHSFAARLRLTLVTGCVASLFIGSYLAYNLATTDHLLPISGAVKQIRTEHYFDSSGIETPFSLEFLNSFYHGYRGAVSWFITSRGIDGMWVAGSRMVLNENSAIGIGPFFLICVAIVVLPVALSRPMEWARFLFSRVRRLAVFGYVLAFGIIDAVVSVVLYPNQLRYAMIRWWFVENEIIIVVTTATVVVAALAYVGRRFFDGRWQAVLVPAALSVLVAYHVQEALRFYWFGERHTYDWNRSWNEESYEAAQWLDANVPQDALVGSWNAGVLGYYSKQRVINLDGLINSFELIPYLREQRIGEYIQEQGIEYLSDMQSMFERHADALEPLRLEAVYSRYNDLMHENYQIYRVLNSEDQGQVAGSKLARSLRGR